MRTLLVDTNVLLDMTIVELGRVDESAERALLGRTSFLTNFTAVLQLKNYLKGFGQVVCSAGSLIEADRLAVASLQRSGNRDYAPSPHLLAFWNAFTRLLANRSAEFEGCPRLGCVPFQLVPEPGTVSRYGPVDEHLLEIARKDVARPSLLSADNALLDRARRIIGERAVAVTGMS